MINRRTFIARVSGAAALGSVVPAIAVVQPPAEKVKARERTVFEIYHEDLDGADEALRLLCLEEDDGVIVASVDGFEDVDRVNWSHSIRCESVSDYVPLVEAMIKNWNRLLRHCIGKWKDSGERMPGLMYVVLPKRVFPNRITNGAVEFPATFTYIGQIGIPDSVNMFKVESDTR